MTTPPPIPADRLGLEARTVEHAIDARWLMAYAAGLGETAPAYLDTARRGGPAAHPLFAVCYEWPALLALRATLMDEAAAARGVHLAHRLVVHRPPRAGDRLATTARVVGLERHRAGALVTVRLASVDAAGAPVSTTEHASLYRGVDVAGSAPSVPPRAEGTASRLLAETATEAIDVPAHAAHVYTECARIWNPIHTDVAVARAAGLPGPILHGTATLALAVGRIVALDCAGRPDRVREVAARFTGMVPMPSRLALRRSAAGDGGVAFDVELAGGPTVLRDGMLVA